MDFILPVIAIGSLFLCYTIGYHQGRIERNLDTTGEFLDNMEQELLEIQTILEERSSVHRNRPALFGGQYDQRNQ